jgi:P-type E1-E2 ATPase
MIILNVPGRGTFELEHLVCDVNGTLALDGEILPGVTKALTALKDRLEVHLITADTHHRQGEIDRQLGLTAQRLSPGEEGRQKADLVRALGMERVVAIGQGANDTEMLEAAALGICVLSREGTALATLMAADIVVPDTLTALELLEKPMRILGTLRR